MTSDRPAIASSIAQLRAWVFTALDAHDFDSAFGAINAAMQRAGAMADTRGLVSVGDPGLDELCLLIGRRWLETNLPDRKAVPPASPTDLYVASMLFEDGGHTPLIGDFIRSRPARRAFLAVTNVGDQPGKLSDTVLRRVALKPSQVEVCQKIRPAEKFAWLIDVMDRTHPNRIFLFNHQWDSVAIAACQQEDGREFVFVHHSDRAPSAGAFLPFAVHIDVTPFCFHSCRHRAGISNTHFVPLIQSNVAATMGSICESTSGPRRETKLKHRKASVALLRSRRPPLPLGLRTAAAGSSHKFIADYDPHYFDAIAAILKVTKGLHVHIGELPRDSLEPFRKVLTSRGVNPKRLIHIPHVPSVWRAMWDYKIDLYIGSFHTRGARTSVEVMGSGTPALWHVTRPAALLHDTHMSYEGAAKWRTLEDLLGIIRGIDREWLTQQSRLARSHYARNHDPMLMVRCLRGNGISSHKVHASWDDSSEPRLSPLDDLLALS